MIIDCIEDLPEHHSLHITHNQHKAYYETIPDYLDGISAGKDILPEDLKECIERDSLWEVQLYPRTPISFYWVGAATFERACDLIKETMKKGGDL